MKGNLEYAEDVRQMGASLQVIDNGLKKRGVNFLSRLMIIHHLRGMKESESFTDRHLFIHKWVKAISIIFPVTFFLTKIIGWYLYDVDSFFKYYPSILSLLFYSLAFSFVFRQIYLSSKTNFHNHFVSYSLDVVFGFAFGFLVLASNGNTLVLSLLFSLASFSILATIYNVELESAMFSSIALFGIFLILNYSLGIVLDVLLEFAPVLRVYLGSLGLEKYALDLSDF